ncbi:hypothetical protein A3C98_01985 [Candidatus Roizmanbacteria bacterium RIFCSPHIGHO2_02_FULL_37_15]|uniref:Uncharacterized protein n=1 Tax=Candidatus Roizmanbacteria bacterium RIFCSPLOWO2_01_FULL_37_16 TaxID=1802058 RepID=A0A1F7IMS4_9BACT|nr:MAG: hypothetical protein A2859_02495 [Candidatus Roizmanbacteria bacterium RIFCSPHIGHO2_01_FULL_37_16b]OGK20513.1 MAG: hypothetical protein A3C98_01985 [Candidatus Roizmanbacteria bacterium RIFCSPHIGHO2_02_FULL_37_15]OGK32206.1 MAG: hypothetical protein A3F57_01440 [Candidatus Roizmanbacteria bacterium RIFCSPHIGHO2_12_FULL_36_11]OGK44665.1 MAG: hypothetical protein A3B40_02500 [Candidatus Roizmanbacteria bacterium RIFCSPLOWO2_01_FULL_37_16]OGK55789.1 MAG: hypothetical protein A3I50_02160 [C
MLLEKRIWQKQLRLPTGLSETDLYHPETPEFWQNAYYYPEVETVLTQQLPKLLRSSVEVQNALATCFLRINLMPANPRNIGNILRSRELLSPSSIYSIFKGSMTDYILEQIGVVPYQPQSFQAYLAYLGKQPEIERKLGGLSLEMKTIAWWSFWLTFDTVIKTSQNGSLRAQTAELNKKEAVDFMQEKLGLRPPKIIS